MTTSPEHSTPQQGRRGRLPALLAGALVTVQVLFVLCLSYPPLHAEPHDVPLGVVAPPPATAQVTSRLPSEAFEVHRYPDVAAARSAIRNREVHGAIVLAPTGARILVATAASPTIADLLSGLSGRLGQNGTVPIVDVVSLPSDDPQEVGALTTLLPLVLLSIVLGAALAFTVPGSRTLLGWCATAALAAGLAVSGLASWLGTFPDSYWANAGVLTLLVFGIAGTSAGLTRHRKLRPVEGLFALTVLLLGIPGAGAMVPIELLPQPWREIGPVLPPAAALDAMRAVTFFDGAAIATSMAVLGGWATLGALLLLAKRAPSATAAPHGRTAVAGADHASAAT